MKGRKPKLVAVDGRRTTPASDVPVPHAKVRVPRPPAGLSKHALAEWRRAAADLAGRGLFGPNCLSALETYCRAVGLTHTYTEMMDRDGHVIETERGQQSHPAFKMLMGTMREARLLAAELGLTPHRRGKTSEGAKEQREGWDDLLA